MSNKVDPGENLSSEIKKDLEAAEVSRKNIRLRHNILTFISGNIDVLKSNEFVNGFIEYIASDSMENSDERSDLLHALGKSAVAPNIAIRERYMTNPFSFLRKKAG